MAQRGGDWTGPQPAQTPPRCTKCNSPTASVPVTVVLYNGLLLCYFNLSIQHLNVQLVSIRVLFSPQYVNKTQCKTRCWHVTISCQRDGRPPQPVRPWKSGRVHLAEGSNVVVLELPYFTEFLRTF